MKCEKCILVVEPCAKVVSPNVYRLYDKIICKVCKIMKMTELGEIDKNTENTTKLLTGNYFVDSKGDVVPKKSSKKSLKEIAEETQNELNIDEWFK